MRITSLRIKNFKSLADTGNIDLGRVNVLVGRNNHGKSAFIKALLYLQQGIRFDQGDVRLGEKEAVVNMSLAGDTVADLQSYFDVGQPTVTYDLRVLISSDGVAVQSAAAPHRGFPQIPSDEPENFIYTYLSKRKVFGFSREVNIKRTRAVQTDLSNLVAKVTRLANNDYEAGEEYSGLCRDLLGFRISPHAASDGNGQQAGIPVGPYDYIPIESMGEGVSSQLGLITDLCMADGNLFLIEEPENDIHPESLKTLLNVIIRKSATNQFLVSTHSNIVVRYLGAAPDARVFEFESRYIRNEIPRSTVLEVPPTIEARVGVLRRLGYELSDFDLWEGWLILEESSAEIIIRYLIPWFVPRLARVRTVAAGGTSKVEPTFEDFRRLFLFAHLETRYRGRAWVIVDGDDEGKKVIAALRDKEYTGWPPEHFITWDQPDFELYYPSMFEEKVRAVLALPHDKKRDAKRRLVNEVKAWCNSNPKAAEAEFELSAAEVIEKLRQIDRAL